MAINTHFITHNIFTNHNISFIIIGIDLEYFSENEMFSSMQRRKMKESETFSFLWLFFSCFYYVNNFFSSSPRADEDFTSPEKWKSCFSPSLSTSEVEKNGSHQNELKLFEKSFVCNLIPITKINAENRGKEDHLNKYFAFSCFQSRWEFSFLCWTHHQHNETNIHSVLT